MKTQTVIYRILCTAVTVALLGGPCTYGAEPQLPPGVSKEQLRTEILRRQAIVLTNNYFEIVPLMRELKTAASLYRVYGLEFLVFFKRITDQVHTYDDILAQMDKLKEEHAELRESAADDGVLVEPGVAKTIRNGNSKGKIYGIPPAAMTFDPEKARIADKYREMQWTLYDAYEENVRRYEKRYDTEYCAWINAILDRRYNLMESLRQDHIARQKKLRRIFVSGTHDAWLGTAAAASFARLRSPDFRLEPDDLPGMKVDLPFIRHHRLPRRILAPPKPELFVLKYDGQKLLDMKIAAEKESARAAEEMLHIEKFYMAYKVSDIARSIFAAAGQPFVESFSNEEWTASQAAAASLAKYGKFWTYDMAKGTVDAAGRLLDKAKPGKIGDSLTQLRDAYSEWRRASEADEKRMAAAGDMHKLLLESPDSPEAKLEYLKKLSAYRDLIDKTREEQKPLMEKVDKAAEVAVDALAVYGAGKGIAKGIKSLKSTRGQQFLKYKEALKKQAELTEQATQISIEHTKFRNHPELEKKATRYLESKQKLDKLQQTKMQSNKAMSETATKLRNKGKGSSVTDPDVAAL